MDFLPYLAAVFVLLSLSLDLATQEVPLKCPAGRFGAGCLYACHCKGSNSCDQLTGSCVSRECAKGFTGDGCQNVNLAFQANTPSRWLVDSDVRTCHAETGSSPHWIDLQQMYWLRRFRIIVNDSSRDMRSISLQVTNSSNTAPNMKATPDMRVMWTPGGQLDIFLQAPVRGRYVWLIAERLQLCEFYVFGGRNIAFRRPTSQSSTHSSFTSSLAVDGQTSPFFDVSPCAHTKKTSGLRKFKEYFKERVAWWKVNLTATHVITRIVIVNREGFLNRLRWFNVRAGLLKPGTLKSVYRSTSFKPGPVINIVPATPLHIGLLQIELYGRGRILTLCEVQLFGECPDKTYGPSCNNSCNCADPEEVCDSFSGVCISGKAKGESTPYPFEEDDDDEASGSTDNGDSEEDIDTSDKVKPGDPGTDNSAPVVVAVVLVVTVLVVIAVAVAVWRRRRNQKKRKSSMTSGQQIPPLPAEDVVYEEVDSHHASGGNVTLPSTSAIRTTPLSLRDKLKHLVFAGRYRNRAQRERNPRAPQAEPQLSADYQNAASSVQGAAGPNVYEPLGARDYDQLYTGLNVRHYERPDAC